MAKKKKVKAATPEVVSFRPGTTSAAEIAQLANTSNVSCGEVARRLVCLALRGMDVEYYPIVDELSKLTYGGSDFEAAAAMIHLHCRERLCHEKKADVGKERRIQIAREFLEQYRVMHGFVRKAEEQVIRINIVLDDE